MPKTKPTHAQAQLQLQLYELRREAKLRQAREWFVGKFYADTVEEINQLAPPGSGENAYMRMVTSYWEQACALLNAGLLHEDLFFEASGEFFLVWERCKSAIPALRKTYKYPPFLINLEKAAQRYERWMAKRAPGHLAAMRQWMQQMRQAAQG
jgi:hypothetical protein